MGIRTRNIDLNSALRYQELHIHNISNTATVTNNRAYGVWWLDAPAKIVDVIVGQAYVGVGGTSQVIALYKNTNTAILSTNITVALAGGVDSVDAKGLLALPTGWTRPVINAANATLVKGDIVSFQIPTINGSYSTAPSINIYVVIDTDPQ